MAEDKVYGWVLLPVAVDVGHTGMVKTFEFEGDHAYFEGDGATSWGWSEAPTYDEALRTMEARIG